MPEHDIEHDDRVRLTRLPEGMGERFEDRHTAGDTGRVAGLRVTDSWEACVAFGDPEDCWWLPVDALELADKPENSTADAGEAR